MKSIKYKSCPLSDKGQLFVCPSWEAFELSREPCATVLNLWDKDSGELLGGC